MCCGLDLVGEAGAQMIAWCVASLNASASSLRFWAAISLACIGSWYVKRVESLQERKQRNKREREIESRQQARRGSMWRKARVEFAFTQGKSEEPIRTSPPNLM